MAQLPANQPPDEPSIGPLPTPETDQAGESRFLPRFDFHSFQPLAPSEVAYLLVVEGSEEGAIGKVIRLDQARNSIGRARCSDFALVSKKDGPCISRQHTLFDYLGGRWIVSDMGSSNGTFVNGRKLGAFEASERYLIAEGDQIGIAGVLVTFHRSLPPA